MDPLDEMKLGDQKRILQGVQDELGRLFEPQAGGETPRSDPDWEQWWMKPGVFERDPKPGDNFWHELRNAQDLGHMQALQHDVFSAYDRGELTDPQYEERLQFLQGRMDKQSGAQNPDPEQETERAAWEAKLKDRMGVGRLPLSVPQPRTP